MTLKDLKPELIFGIFDQITKVPRPSKKEGKIREFLIDFAEKNGIEYDKTKFPCEECCESCRMV